MPRSVQITRDKILKAAMDILIREGYSAVNIKSIARELNCSTQPISWQFGNMDSMREALTNEAVAYTNQKLQPTEKNSIAAFWQIGKGYINLAFDEPNLFRFIYMGESRQYCRGRFDSILIDEGNAALLTEMTQYLGVSKEKAGTLMQRLILYTHGVVSLIVADVLTYTKEEVCTMVRNFGVELLSCIGTDLDMSSILAEIPDEKEHCLGK